MLWNHLELKFCTVQVGGRCSYLELKISIILEFEGKSSNTEICLEPGTSTWRVGRICINASTLGFSATDPKRLEAQSFDLMSDT